MVCSRLAVEVVERCGVEWSNVVWRVHEDMSNATASEKAITFLMIFLSSQPSQRLPKRNVMILEDLYSVQPEELLAWLAGCQLAGCLNGCRQGRDGTLQPAPSDSQLPALHFTQFLQTICRKTFLAITLFSKKQILAISFEHLKHIARIEKCRLGDINI